MAVNDKPLTSNDVTVTLRDGTGTPITLTLTNDVSVSVEGLTGRALNETVQVQRRGKHFGLAHGQRVYPTVTIEYIHNGWAGATSAPGTPLEFVTFQGLYAANVSTTSGGTRSVKTVDVGIVFEGTDYGDADGTLTLSDCYLQSHTLLSEGEPSTYSMTLVCVGDVSGDLDYDEA